MLRYFGAKKNTGIIKQLTLFLNWWLDIQITDSGRMAGGDISLQSNNPESIDDGLNIRSLEQRSTHDRRDASLLPHSPKEATQPAQSCR